ncbi:hypothetical protein [Rufibacter roseus]|uniref:Uncharacterized protein n=1 Tax=Rufibacter roseus TaxID=1567108 RepID=A0ABW2DNE8_9BACT|nr:hypothetical protein [Rufibacter roseus]
MKAIVLTSYRDKHTRKVHTAGDKVTLTPERHAELSALGYVSTEEAPAKKESKPGAKRKTKEDKTAKDTK